MHSFFFFFRSKQWQEENLFFQRVSFPQKKGTCKNSIKMRLQHEKNAQTKTYLIILLLRVKLKGFFM